MVKGKTQNKGKEKGDKCSFGWHQKNEKYKRGNDGLLQAGKRRPLCLFKSSAFPVGDPADRNDLGLV